MQTTLDQFLGKNFLKCVKEDPFVEECKFCHCCHTVYIYNHFILFQAIFELVDPDNSGSVSFDEYMKMCENRPIKKRM